MATHAGAVHWSGNSASPHETWCHDVRRLVQKWNERNIICAYLFFNMSILQQYWNEIIILRSAANIHYGRSTNKHKPRTLIYINKSHKYIQASQYTLYTKAISPLAALRYARGTSRTGHVTTRHVTSLWSVSLFVVRVPRTHRRALIDHFVHCGLLVARARHDVLVVRRDVAAEHRWWFLRLQQRYII